MFHNDPCSISSIVLREKGTAFQCQARLGYTNLLEPAGHDLTDVPQSLAHLSHKPPSPIPPDGVGELGDSPPACEAFLRKCIYGTKRRHSIYRSCILVDPLTQIFHQHATATQFGIEGIPARYRSALL